MSLGQRVLECKELLQPSSIGIAASVGVEKVKKKLVYDFTKCNLF